MNWTTVASYLAAHWLEVSGTVITIVGIWLTTRRLLICWPVVLVANIIYLNVFFQARLYSDSLLQMVFTILTLYGWWHWWRGKREEGEVRVVSLSRRGWITGLAAGAAGAFLLGWLMAKLGAALPHLDAALASYSLVASWWQTRKHIANWWLWIAVDLVYIGEYIYKGLGPTAVLYVGLIVLAVLGLRGWRGAETKGELESA